MKISLTLKELHEGVKECRFREDKLIDMEILARRREALGLANPLHHGNRTYSVVIPTRFEHRASGRQELYFFPVYQRCWTVCHIRSHNLRSVILELENGKQLEFNGGKEPIVTHYTTAGDGVGEQAVEKSEIKLAALLEQVPRSHVLDGVLSFLSQLTTVPKAGQHAEAQG